MLNIVTEDKMKFHVEYDEYIWGDKFKEKFSQTGFYSNIDFVLNNVSDDSNYVITHNGDYAVDDHKVSFYKNLKKWFGQNVITTNSKVIPIPIGLENDYIAGQPSKKFFLEKLSKIENNPNSLIYLNCNINTFIVDRLPAYQHFVNQKWCTTKLHGTVSYEQYCVDILKHKFVVCPRGNGLDCHRNWETLYLGRYPVMKKCHSLEKLYSDLPVLFVDEWEQVTEELLLSTAENFAFKQFNYDKLKFSYWSNLIEKDMVQKGILYK